MLGAHRANAEASIRPTLNRELGRFFKQVWVGTLDPKGFVSLGNSRPFMPSYSYVLKTWFERTPSSATLQEDGVGTTVQFLEGFMKEARFFVVTDSSAIET